MAWWPEGISCELEGGVVAQPAENIRLMVPTMASKTLYISVGRTHLLEAVAFIRLIIIGFLLRCHYPHFSCSAGKQRGLILSIKSARFYYGSACINAFKN
jgi:hypothetical protein